MIPHPYRGTCKCGGYCAVVEIEEGRKAVVVCPACSKRPDLAISIALLATLEYVEHAKECKTCQFPGVTKLCKAGLAALNAAPGYPGVAA